MNHPVVTQVPVHHVSTIWHRVAHYLEPAVNKSRGRWTMPALLASLANGRTSLWLMYMENGLDIKAAGVTMVQEYPNRRIMEVVFLGGVDMTEWISKTMSTLKRYAYDMGCDGVETIGRHGLGKTMKAYGFDSPYAVYEYNLERTEI